METYIQLIKKLAGLKSRDQAKTFIYALYMEQEMQR